MSQVELKIPSKLKRRRSFTERLRHTTAGLIKKYYRKANVFDRRQKKEIIIDVIGSCNLRCPSCPVGHSGQVNPSGLMDKKLFGELIAKADRDYKVSVVSLYNWTEPLLNPELPELVEIIHKNHLRCRLSSNLNVLRDSIDDVLLAKPHYFRISLSGFTQAVYSQTHVGGNIERVKDNMRRLSEAVRRTKSKTTVSVFYHKYKHNLHEAAPMREFAESLGFGWSEGWAYYMGTEKLIGFLDGTLQPIDLERMKDLFALPIRDALEATKPFRNEPCPILKSQLVLDMRGNLLPCCTVYDNQKNNLGSYMDLSVSDVDRAKRNASICSSCAAHGIHLYSSYWSLPHLVELYDGMAKTAVAKSQQNDDQQSRAA